MIPATPRARLRRALLVSLATAAFLIPRSGAVPAAVAAGDAGGDPPRVSVDASQMAHAVAFRERSGFRSDSAFVEATFSDKAFSSAQWGVPLSANELADLDKRVSNQKALEPAFA